MITGFLGVGKTTAILDLFHHARPADERWAIVVNEFGEVGIDGATMAESGASIAEIPGGCICCTAGLQLRVAIGRLLKEQNPDRVLIEPTGLAVPAEIVDLLRGPGLSEAIDVRASITLIDPHQWGNPRYRTNPTYKDQLQIADVLVANKVDLCTEEELAAFYAGAGELYPPKMVIAQTTDAKLDPAWIDLEPSVSTAERHHHHHHHVDDGPSVIEARDGGVVRQPHAGEVADTCGWIFPPDVIFDRSMLREVLQVMVRPSELLPNGVMRLKGVFRTKRVWQLVNASATQIKFDPINYRRDSRVEIIVEAGSGVDWDAVEERLRSAMR